MMTRLLLSILLHLGSITHIQAQDSIYGLWKTIDDETKEPKSIVEIFERDGKIFGKIVKLFLEPGEDQNPICDECIGEKRNDRIIGMEIIMEMSDSGNEWINGEILDPENGKIYKCKLWLEDGLLKVRGYIMFFYRTQTWHRVSE